MEPLAVQLRRKLKTMGFLIAGGGIAFGSIGIWTGNSKFFEQILVPVLNRVDPEMSHRAAIWLTKHHLIKSSPSNQSPWIPDEGNPVNLKIKIGSLEFSNPVGLAAGFDKSGECISGLQRLGLGWVEIGSITPEPQFGNPKPRVFRLPQDEAVINRYGFNNDGHTKVHERVQAFKNRDSNYPVGINLGANKDSENRIQDYVIGVQRFSDVADYFVINISSPNTPNLRELQKDESLTILLKNVIEARNKESRKVPILVKVAPDLTDPEIKSICKIVRDKNTRVDGIIVSNTTITRDVLITSDESLKSQAGGLSGKPLSKMSTELIGKFYKELKGEIPIIGVGGIWDGKDAYEKICAGANAIQLYTVLTYRGPGVVQNVKDELSHLLSVNGFKTVEEAVGSTHRKK